MPIDNKTCKTCNHRTKLDDIVRCRKGNIEIQNEHNIYVPCKDWKPECYGKEYIDYETGSIKIYGEEQIMNDETTYIYEVRDITMAEPYYLLGVFSTIEKAREILCNNEPCAADGAYLEDYCVMSIVEIPVDNIKKHSRTIAEHRYKESYNEKTEKLEWHQEYTIVEGGL